MARWPIDSFLNGALNVYMILANGQILFRCQAKYPAITVILFGSKPLELQVFYR